MGSYGEHMRIIDLWKIGEKELCLAEVTSPRWEAELLLRGALGISRTQFIAYPEVLVETSALETFRSYLQKRILGMPTQYILGRQEFYGRDFHLTPDVLIPRVDSEIIIEEALKKARRLQDETSSWPFSVLDLCTGSGCLGLTIASELPWAEVTLTDISISALQVAMINSKKLGVVSQIRFRSGDLFAAIGQERFHLIVSNPPYIPSGTISALQKEVQCEPRQALDGGEDGLDFYRKIIEEAPNHLLVGGYLLLEVGMGQAEAVKALLQNTGDGSFCLNNIYSAFDFAGIERVVMGQFAFFA
ncbi:MAG: peptide chain release factor N(5)-glutamine methyltransferase [bacterium]|nr:peptide chain release factor N(5)-glutamine methyltransferase [bacterium]